MMQNFLLRDEGEAMFVLVQLTSVLVSQCVTSSFIADQDQDRAQVSVPSFQVKF